MDYIQKLHLKVLDETKGIEKQISGKNEATENKQMRNDLFLISGLKSKSESKSSKQFYNQTLLDEFSATGRV